MIIKERNKDYRINNKEKRREYENKRLKESPTARLANRFRNLTNKIIKNKRNSAMTLIGCSYEELKTYLESKFKPGMTWDNWSNNGWQIDHIQPLCSFDLTNSAQQHIACNYINLQPLWKEEHELKTKQDLMKHQKKVKSPRKEK